MLKSSSGGGVLTVSSEGGRLNLTLQRCMGTEANFCLQLELQLELQMKVCFCAHLGVQVHTTLVRNKTMGQ